MLLKPLSVAAGLLAVPAAHAFLLPPEVSESDIQIANTLEMVAPGRAESQVVELECLDCPILVKGRHGKAIEIQIDRPNHLEMTFSVDHQPDYDRLLVNGFELYPSGDPIHDALFAPQVIDRQHSGKDTEKRHRDGKHHRRPHHLVPQRQRLGWALHVGEPKPDAEGEFELVEVELQVIEVGYTFVDGIPNVKVKLIKDGSGRLVISEIEKSEPKRILELPNGKPEECTTLLCKMIAMAREKFNKFKSFGHCPGKMKGGMMPAAGEAPHDHPHQDPHPDGPADDEWSPVPYRAHSWAKLFKNIGSHILLPVLVGIVAGVSVSIIGMVVGTVLVSLWRVFRRRRSHRHRHSGRAHHRAARKEAALSEEKSGLMEDQEAPPAYEEEDTAKVAHV
ncbi:hypothetical protein VTK26DRAFT_3804 [Humicola hyalothermophila]